MLKRCLRALLALLPLLATAFAFGVVAPASAATTITPMLFTDGAGNACTTDATCTLRGAINKADGMSGATIQLLAGTYHLNNSYNGTDDGATGDLEITAPMTIKGAGATQTTVVADSGLGGLGDRVFEAGIPVGAGPVAVTISDLKVTGGSPPASSGGENDGGGILNDGDNLTINNVVFDTNQTNRVSGQGGTFWGNGGGLASENSGTITVTNSTFNGNTSFDGGGLYNNGHTSTFSHLLFTNNTANGQILVDSGGGAIFDEVTSGFVVAFSDITATSNHATQADGGAVYEESSPANNVHYDRVTLSGNTAIYEGGGFYAGNTTTTITNSTITGNTQQPVTDSIRFDNGGGVAIGETGTVNLNNDTISNNTSENNGGGLFANAFDQFNVHNTIVVNNHNAGGAVANCDYLADQTNKGAINSQGYNIANDTSCNFTGTADRQGASFDPNLGVLADNGGPRNGAPGADSPTLTRALPTGSIAINTADNANCPPIDQRGVTRPQQGTCDVGAYEYVAAAASAAPAATPALPKAGTTGQPADLRGVLLAAMAVLLIPLALRRARAQ